MNGWKKTGRDLESEGQLDVWIMDGCLKRLEEEEVMQVCYSLNNESQNILNMINNKRLPWWGAKNFKYKESPRYSIY